MSTSKAPGKKIRRLSDVVREARIAAAEREDVVVDMREADRARLELLTEELAPIFDEVPAGDDQFDFYVSSGEHPRLWIDAIAHVHMGNDRRTYRFVRDTRFGRVVIAEEADMMTVADSVTRYVAERIVQRQRFLDSDPLNVSRPAAPAGAKKLRQAAETTAVELPKTSPADPGQTSRSVPVNASARQFSVAAALLWFLFGMVVAGAVMVAALREQIAPMITIF